MRRRARFAVDRQNEHGNQGGLMSNALADFESRFAFYYCTGIGERVQRTDQHLGIERLNVDIADSADRHPSA